MIYTSDSEVSVMEPVAANQAQLAATSKALPHKKKVESQPPAVLAGDVTNKTKDDSTSKSKDLIATIKKMQDDLSTQAATLKKVTVFHFM